MAILASVLLISLCYHFGYLPQKQSEQSSQESVGRIGGQNETSSQETGVSTGIPSIFATLSFSNAVGFVTTVHPTSGTIEYLLLPNSVGEFTVSYKSINNLTVVFFTDSGGALAVLQNGTLGTVSGLSVTQSSPTLVSPHEVVVTYTITSGGTGGLYVLGLPSTFYTTIVEVGTQPYEGPLAWLTGTFS